MKLAKRDGRIANVVAWIAGMISCVLVVTFPSLFFISGYQREQGLLTAMGVNQADHVSMFIGLNPRTWHFEKTRLEFLLEKEARHLGGISSVIRDHRGQVVAQHLTPQNPPVISQVFPILDFGTTVGILELHRSYRPLLINTGIVLVVGFVLGVMVFFPLRLVPLRALRLATSDLAREKEYVGNIIKSMMDSLIVVSPEGTILTANRTTLDILGYAEEELLNAPIGIVIAEEEEESIFRGVGLADLVRKGFVANVETTYLTREGRRIPMLFSGSVMRDDDGVFVGVVCLATDITERKHAEEALRESKQRLNFLVSASPAVIYTANVEGDYAVTFISENIREQLGYEPKDFLDDPAFWLKNIHPDDRSHVTAELGGALKKKNHYSHEYRFLAKDGGYRWMHDEFRLVCGPDGDHLNLVGYWVDITERKRTDEKTLQLQDELAHVDRLSIMGEMAAGLAHEINQPLAAVVNFAQGCVHRLRSGKTKPGELLDALEQISVQAGRAGEIIHRIRGFIGKEEPRMTSVDVNAAIREATGLLEFEAREHAVTLNMDLANPLPKVRGNTIQIQQIILNLARNGMEAMSENGSTPRLLTIRSSATKSGTVEIAVHDNHYGVSTESLELLFESFLTTKTGGLGLGLSICRSIVESHGGRLWVTTDGVNDTAFRFTLPVA